MKRILALFLLHIFLTAFSVFLSAEDNIVKFIVLGDTRGNMVKTKINLEFLEILKMRIVEEKPDFIFVNGDLVSGYSDKLESQLEEWRDKFMRPLLEHDLQVYVCRGNHDVSKGWKIHKYPEALKEWNEIFSGIFSFPENGPVNEKNLTYYVKKNNTVIFVFDNYIDKAHHKVNYKWMEKVLKNINSDKKEMKVFALCHEPAFSADHPDCLAVHKKERDDFVKTFLKNGGIFFFSGHDHFYNHAQVKTENGVFEQFICGTDGAPLKTWNEKYAEKGVENIKYLQKRGYVKVTVKNDDVKLEYIVFSPEDKTWKIEETVTR